MSFISEGCSLTLPHKMMYSNSIDWEAVPQPTSNFVLRFPLVLALGKRGLDPIECMCLTGGAPGFSIKVLVRRCPRWLG
jgi:hypothetical protein